MSKEETKKVKKPLLRRTLEIFGKTLLALLVVILLLITSLRIPYVQQKMADKATAYLSDKLETRIELQRIYLTYSIDLVIEGLLIEDQSQQPLLQIERFRAGVKWRPLFSKQVVLKPLELSGLEAHAYSVDSTRFNFSFIPEYFSTPDAEVLEDTASESTPPNWEIIPEKIILSDLFLSFEDTWNDMHVSASLKELTWLPGIMHLENASYDLGSLVLNGLQADVKLPDAAEDSEDEASNALLPTLFWQHISLQNIQVNYSEATGQNAIELSLGNFELGAAELNLPKEQIKISSVLLENTELWMRSIQSDMASTPAPPTPDKKEAESTPHPLDMSQWQIEVNALNVRNNIFTLESIANETGRLVGSSVFELDQISLQNIHYLDTEAGFSWDLKNIQVAEFIDLKESSGSISLLRNDILLRNIELTTAQSFAAISASIRFNDWEEWINEPTAAQFALSIPSSLIDLSEFWHLAPELKKQPGVKGLATQKLSLIASINGNSKEINIDNIGLGWGKNTYLKTEGQIKNWQQVEKMKIDLPLLAFGTQKKDIQILELTPEDLLLPQYVRLNSQIKGSLSDLKLNAYLASDLGSGQIAMNYQHDAEQPAYKIAWELIDIAIQDILDRKELGPVTLTGTLEGSGNKMENLDIFATLQLQDFCYNDVFFAQTSLEAVVKDQLISAQLALEEDFLKGNIEIQADLNPALPEYATYIQLDLADLQTLGFTKTALQIELDLNAHLAGNAQELAGGIRLHSGKASTEEAEYEIKQVLLDAEADSLHTHLFVQTNWLQIRLDGNASPESLIEMLTEFGQSLTDPDYTVPHEPMNRRIFVDMTIIPDSFLTQVLIPDLEDFHTSGLKISYSEVDQSLDVTWPFSHIRYGDWEMKNYEIKANASNGTLHYYTGFQVLNKEDFDIHRTRLSGFLSPSNQSAWLSLKSEDKVGQTAFLLANKITYKKDSLAIQIHPDSLILNKLVWDVPKNNQLLLYNNKVNARNFELKRDRQLIALYNIPGRSDDHLGILMENFKIESLSSVVYTDESPISGVLQANLFAERLFSNPLLTGNIRVDNLYALDQDWGQLKINLERRQDLAVTVKSSLEGPVMSSSINGIYQAKDEEQDEYFQLALNINTLDVSLLDKLAAGEIREASGNMQGAFSVSGSFDNWDLDGNVNFTEAGLIINQLNERFTLRNERITLNKSGIYLDAFTIRNSADQESVISGSIGLLDLNDPTLSLGIRANNFRVINSTRKDNDLFFGTLHVDFNMEVSGSVNQPIVSARTRLLKDSEVTFIVPESELELIEKEGVVLFVNMAEGGLTEEDEERLAVSKITGIELSAILNIDSGTVFRVILDERMGDNLTVAGAANLNFVLETNGRMGLSGSYTITKGQYELNLYDLVRRRFEMVPGSRITWSGDPYNASLDLRALYRVRTSSMDLMAAQLINADPGKRAMYRQELPFEVYLNIGGELLRPQISFRIDMPESHREAMGGNVYARVVQLNENESELNKQVFSLMVLNKFLPEDLTGGSAGGGTTALARSSVSQVLSNQLNALSDRFIQGVDLDFDLDSYTDFQGGTGADRTQLSVRARKALLDDRLVISVGSQFDLENQARQGPQNAADIIGDINLEYLITPDGRYRVRGFRRNEFEGMVEGLLIVAGVSLVYRKEFDRLSELWKSSKEEPPPKSSPFEEIKEFEIKTD